MKKEEFNKLCDSNKSEDGKYNFDNIFEGVNKSTNDTIAKNKPNEEELKSKFRNEYETDIFKGLGIEGVTNQEQFKAHTDTIGKSTDDNAKRVTELQGKLTESEKTFETMQKDFTNSKNESSNNAFKLDVYEENYNPKYMNAIQAEYKARTNGKEEFDKKDIHKGIKEDFSEWVNDFKADKGNFGNKTPNSTKDNGWEVKPPSGGFNFQNYNRK